MPRCEVLPKCVFSLSCLDGNVVYFHVFPLKFDKIPLSPFANFVNASNSFLFWLSTWLTSEISSSFCFLSLFIYFCIVIFLFKRINSPFSSLKFFWISNCSLTSYSSLVRFNDCYVNDLNSSPCYWYSLKIKSPKSL